jgi:hypothetical protein
MSSFTLVKVAGVGLPWSKVANFLTPKLYASDMSTSHQILSWAGQKARQFWAKVGPFLRICLFNVDDDYVERDQKALMHRFKRKIQKHVSFILIISVE